MAIRQFDVGPLRGLARAAAQGLGNLVVVAGPNGAGKSTMLDLIKSNRWMIAEPGTTVMFVGPHRTWRSSQLNRVAIYDYQLPSYGAALESESLPSFRYQIPTGMQGLQGMPRQSSSADDVQAFVKTSLIRLRDKRQALIADAYATQGGQVAAGTVPDLFEPFEALIDLLLPHLEWVGISDANPENISAQFRPKGATWPLFDIDELSSGEKAAIALMLPIVERQADDLVSPRSYMSGLVPLTMILDEPEIHLHPLLQLQVLEYMRKLGADGIAQFIISTHSPTILDALTDDELFLLSPASVSPSNQLRPLTTSFERLELARELTGSTHVLTRAKPIVFVEGEVERAGGNSDARLIGMLFPATRSWALVPAQSKRSVTDSVSRLHREAVDLPGVPVFGLVDADSDDDSLTDHVISWPVAMVENLLLSGEGVYQSLAPFGAQTRATSVEAVDLALTQITESMVDEEVRIRIKRRLPVGKLEVNPLDLSTASEALHEQGQKWVAKIDALTRSDMQEVERSEVRGIVDSSTQSQRFHGKKILRGLYDSLRVQDAGIGYSAFVYSLAAQDATRQHAERVGGASIRRIQLYFPTGLEALLRERVGDLNAQSLAEECASEAAEWRSGSPRADNRGSLRNRVFDYARDVDEPIRGALVRLASQIGTA